jgi:hypothetical protein
VREEAVASKARPKCQLWFYTDVLSEEEREEDGVAAEY